MSSGAVAFDYRVRYRDVDLQGYLFNAVHLQLADDALTEYMRDLGWEYVEMIAAGLDPSVVDAHVRYRRPARLGDLLSVETVCREVGVSSLRLDTRITRSGEGIAEIEIVYVNVDICTHASAPIPADICEQFRARVHPLEESRI